jgi:hypothetical protein
MLQCLFSNGGYTYLDVRTALEYEDVSGSAGTLQQPVTGGDL